MRIKNSSEYRKQENDGDIASRRMKGISENRWQILPGDVY